MKTQFLVVVTIENDEKNRQDATREAELAMNSFVRIKNQHGCGVNLNKLTFSIPFGPTEIN